jgi:hypothetical protein
MNPDNTIPLTRVRELSLEGQPAHALARAALAGRQRRIFRGVYASTSAWQEASDRERHLARMRAAAATRMSHPVVFSHQSAAVLWGIPILGDWPNEVHLHALGKRGVRSRGGIVWHRGAITEGEVCEVDGMLVTGMLRTVVDLARSMPFASAVVSLDYATKPRLTLPGGEAMAGIPRARVLARLDDDAPARGARSARAALAFSNPLSGSPGESCSRVEIHRLRFRPPRLQVPVPRRDGQGKDIPDFDWPEAFGEFDGKVKYTRDQYTRGRPMEEIVWAEKRREDRLRRAGKKDMARWVWSDVMNPMLLRDILLDTGLVPLSEVQYRRECQVMPK